MTPEQLTLDKILPALLGSAGFFCALLVVAFVIERVTGLHRTLPACAARRPLNFDLLADTLLWALPLTIVTLLASQLSQSVSSWLGLELPQQQLVQILRNERTPTDTRWAIALFALLEAPLFEEGLFRRFLFRNALRLRVLKPAVVMVLTGALFALAHFNAVTFLPLTFFGAALAWTYYRTGRILVPMTIHFLFNLINLLLLYTFPEMG